MKRIIVLIAISAVALMSVAVTADAASTSERSQATSMAKSYLRSQGFSKSGLVEQLEYEGFSHSAAVWGAGHAGANWLTQAVLVAKSYLRSQPFSRSGLVEQLEYEGFTHYQAAYGVSRAYR
jgi:Host cell surface-exposed lipoprotein